MTGTGLTRTWTPPNLQVFHVGSPTTGAVNAGDLRRVMPGTSGELIVKALILQYGTGKLVVVAQRNTGAGRELWMARFNPN